MKSLALARLYTIALFFLKQEPQIRSAMSSILGFHIRLPKIVPLKCSPMETTVHSKHRKFRCSFFVYSSRSSMILSC